MKITLIRCVSYIFVASASLTRKDALNVILSTGVEEEEEEKLDWE